MHICVGNLTIIGSDNGLAPHRRQAIIWTNAEILLIGHIGANFSEISTKILTFSFKKMRLKASSAKWRPFCLSLNVLIMSYASLDMINIGPGNGFVLSVQVMACSLMITGHYLNWRWLICEALRDLSEVSFTGNAEDISHKTVFENNSFMWLTCLRTTKLLGAILVSLCLSIRLSVRLSVGPSVLHPVSAL